MFNRQEAVVIEKAGASRRAGKRGWHGGGPQTIFGRYRISGVNESKLYRCRMRGIGTCTSAYLGLASASTCNAPQKQGRPLAPEASQSRRLCALIQKKKPLELFLSHPITLVMFRNPCMQRDMQMEHKRSLVCVTRKENKCVQATALRHRSNKLTPGIF